MALTALMMVVEIAGGWVFNSMALLADGWHMSSHALALGRVYGLRFHTAVFTNLTRDHLDFHGTMEAYFAAKRKLFEGAGAPAPPRMGRGPPGAR